jgi:hypothetical protein
MKTINYVQWEDCNEDVPDTSRLWPGFNCAQFGLTLHRYKKDKISLARGYYFKVKVDLFWTRSLDSECDGLCIVICNRETAFHTRRGRGERFYGRLDKKSKREGREACPPLDSRQLTEG